MRRKKAMSVVVKAPSKGLITRWPSETADRFSTGAAADLATVQEGMVLNRACVVAENMRFEDGVMANAPGYASVQVVPPILASAVAHWKLDEVSDPRQDSFGLNPLRQEPGYLPGGQAAGKLGQAFEAVQGGAGSDMPHLAADTNTQFSFGTSSFTFTGWVKFSQVGAGLGGVAVVTKTSAAAGFEYQLVGSGTAMQIFVQDTVGLKTATVAGVLVANTWHFFCVRYDTGTNHIKLSIDDQAAVAQASTATAAGGLPAKSCRFAVGRYANAMPGAPTTVTVDSVTVWSRAITDAEVTALYNGGAGLEYPFTASLAFNFLYEGNLILTSANPSSSRPLVAGTSSSLYEAQVGLNTDLDRTLALTQLFTGTAGNTGYLWSAVDFFDRMIFAQAQNVPQQSIGGNSASSAVPGLAVSSVNPFSATSDGYEKFEGVASFFGHAIFWRQDLLLWSDLNDAGNYIPIGQTVVSTVLTTSHNYTQPAVGSPIATVGFAWVAGPVLVVGQYVRLIYANGGVNEYNYYQVTGGAAPTATTAELTLLGTTGRTASGTVVPTAQTITTLDANEAGSARLVGARVNGPIFQATQMGDYAYVFKEWSIQSLQYVGQGSGTFYSRTEVVNEGLLGRNALVNLGNGKIIFLGHRELYVYAGGAEPTPVCRQYTRQIFAEVDRLRLSEIVMHHRQLRNEVWIVYPTLTGQKVLIWNYVEDTASLDTYEAGLGGLTACSRSTWVTSLPWSVGTNAQTWESFAATVTWASLQDAGTQDLTLVATASGTLFVHGESYDRDGGGYRCVAETTDFDLEDNAVFKYVDVVRVGLQVKMPDSIERLITVEVGGRSTLDAEITWTPPQTIAVQGNANFTAKVNPGGAGRYLRLRFSSAAAGVSWRVSSFEIYARGGGTF